MATMSNNALIPVMKVMDCSNAPTKAPIRFAPRALLFSCATAKERTNTIPLNSIGRLVSDPTITAFVKYGKKPNRARSTKYKARHVPINKVYTTGRGRFGNL